MPVALKNKSPKKMPRSPGGKRDNPDYAQLNANLPKSVLRRIRLYCTALDINISEAALEAFTVWLEENKDKVSDVILDD